MSETRKWPDIGGLHNVLKDPHAAHAGMEVYRAKVKLDGTNAAVRFRNGVLEGYQSRTRDVTPEDDNAGFARWASDVPWPSGPYFPQLPGLPVVAVHGEWAGPGVQKGTSVSKIPQKSFFVFAVEFSSESLDPDTGDWAERILQADPDVIETWFGHLSEQGVHVLPWYGEEVCVDLNDRDAVTRWAEAINAQVEAVEACDPYVKEVFGVEGVGEGLVFYPGVRNRKYWSRLAFKAKGEKHRVKASKTAVEVDPEVLANVEAFVQAFVTEARCEQGAGVVAGSPEALTDKHIGPFLAWVGADVKKESVAELAASGLTWKDVGGPVTKAAQRWVLAKVRGL